LLRKKRDGLSPPVEYGDLFDLRKEPSGFEIMDRPFGYSGEEDDSTKDSTADKLTEGRRSAKLFSGGGFMGV
jgi:hypothetical protein